jgi:enamine deaminase RidA (YjgF/YER057c/UK114 family)
MRVKIFPWLGHEFISLSWGGSGEGTVAEETCGIFALFSERLKQFGLTLDHTVRTRMFTRDMDTWTAANQERARILSGKARSVSSSHIWPDRLGPKARITIDLMAMFAPPRGDAKVLKEYDPQTIVLRRMNWGGVLFLSGVTDMTHATLDEQFSIIIKRLTDTLSDGGGSWDKVKRASFFLHHEEKLECLRDRFSKTISAKIPSCDYTFVGSRQGKRLEIELTAKLD